MIHIDSFETLQEAKNATLYSPVIAAIMDSYGSYKTLRYKGDADGIECIIKGDTIDDAIIKERWDYLTFTCTQAGGISMSHYGTNKTTTPPNIEYSLNFGAWTTWVSSDEGATFPNINLTVGDIVQMRGINNNGIAHAYYDYSKFVMTGKIEASGNIMSLIDGQKDGTKVIPSGIYCFNNLFNGCTSLIVAPELPATILADYCYYRMFVDCIRLRFAPILPAASLKRECYAYMFYGCTNLIKAPELLALTPAYGCYYGMFINCTNLITGPSILPAINVYDSYAYREMFQNCRNLETAPVIYAERTGYDTMTYMFLNCSKINYIDMRNYDPSQQEYTNALGSWVSGVAATGTFIRKTGSTWESGASGIPSGWTVIDA